MPQAIFGQNALQDSPFSFLYPNSTDPTTSCDPTIPPYEPHWPCPHPHAEPVAHFPPVSDGTSSSVPAMTSSEHHFPGLNHAGPLAHFPVVNDDVGTSCSATSNNMVEFENNCHPNRSMPPSRSHWPGLYPSGSLTRSLPVDDDFVGTSYSMSRNIVDCEPDYFDDATTKNWSDPHPDMYSTYTHCNSDNPQSSGFNIGHSEDRANDSDTDPESPETIIDGGLNPWSPTLEEDAETSSGSTPPPRKRRRQEQLQVINPLDLGYYERKADGKWGCLWPSGCRDTFKRKIDLKRHQGRKDHAGLGLPCSVWECPCGQNLLFREDAGKRHARTMYKKHGKPIPAWLEERPSTSRRR